MPRVLWLALIAALVLLAGAARCWPLRETFIEGKIYFADPDCYSRMTRVRQLVEQGVWSIRRHDFENHPEGVVPHTTAPMDFVIAGLKKILDAGLAAVDSSSVLRGQTLDLAGALSGPLLGMLTCLALAAALPKSEPGQRGRILAAVGLFAISPIAVHGGLLGRPDHQSLLLALLAVALALELRMLAGPGAPRPAVPLVAGTAWGLALWVSLYEPLVFLALALLGLLAAKPTAFGERARWGGWGALLGVFALSVLLDGWRLQWPDAALRAAFARWSATIGELQPLELRGPVLWRWLGVAGVLAPLALAWPARARREARFALGLLLAGFALTIWQVRWGYFLALLAALSLPLALAAVPRAWLAWVGLFAGLWPVAQDWDERLFPDDAELRRRALWRAEQLALRDLAELERRENGGPFLAPWWLSPALAYWSGQPGVAGSSHESLPGILDSARVYLAPDAQAALPLLQARGVRWIVSDAPERVVPASAALLGVPVPAHCLAHELTRRFADPAYPFAIIPPAGVPRAIGHDFFQAWRVP
jgi:hypothetical protein